MNSSSRLAAIVLYAVVLHFSPALALHSGLSGFSSDFLRDFAAAQKAVDQSKSAEPLLILREKYTNATERAELELSIGLAYGQRTGVVDPAKAVAHFTAALQLVEVGEQATMAMKTEPARSSQQLFFSFSTADLCVRSNMITP